MNAFLGSYGTFPRIAYPFSVDWMRGLRCFMPSIFWAAWLIGITWFPLTHSLVAQESGNLTEGLTFLAGFDTTADASFSLGDGQVYHAKSLSLKDPIPGLPMDIVQLEKNGKYGGCLKFGKRSELFTFYRGEKNVAYNSSSVSGTVSLWMRLDPQKDLEPGFVDPIQITDKAWNDSCLFLDFTKDDTPRHFRLGVFSDHKYWNPQDTPWDNIAVSERPMIVMEQPSFGSDHWTHVVFVWSNFNSEKSLTELFIDGKSVGKLKTPQKFTWDTSKLAIIPGIYYSGLMDELAIWNRPLSVSEIQQLFGREHSLLTDLNQ